MVRWWRLAANKCVQGQRTLERPNVLVPLIPPMVYAIDPSRACACGPMGSRFMPVVARANGIGGWNMCSVHVTP